MDRDNVNNLVSLADHLTPLTPDRSGQPLLTNTMFQDEDVDLYVDSAEDDLDKGSQIQNISINGKSQSYPKGGNAEKSHVILDTSNIQQVLKLDVLGMGSKNHPHALQNAHLEISDRNDPNQLTDNGN